VQKLAREPCELTQISEAKSRWGLNSTAGTKKSFSFFVLILVLALEENENENENEND